MAVPITPVRLGDVVRLKKAHPCGANEWQVTRLGADIKLKCVGCERQVMLERYQFDRRFRGFITRAEPTTEAASEAASPAGEPKVSASDEAGGEA